MGFSFAIEDGVFVTSLTGRVGGPEISSHIRDLIEAALPQRFFIEIVKIASTAVLDIDSDYAYSLGSAVKPLHEPYERCHIVVVTTVPVHYGLSRMVQAYVTSMNPSIEWHMVTDEDEAMRLARSLVDEMNRAPATEIPD